MDNPCPKMKEEMTLEVDDIGYQWMMGWHHTPQISSLYIEGEHPDGGKQPREIRTYAYEVACLISMGQ